MNPLRSLVDRWVRRSRTHSPWVVHFDCGSCNGCDIEILDVLTPIHSAERFGVVNVGDPRQADILLVTGAANLRNAAVLRATYDQMAEPKAVVAIGACAAFGGVFHGAPNILGGVGEVIPVDAYVPGCPPRPEAILAGVLKVAPLLAEPRSRPQANVPVQPEAGPAPANSTTSTATGSIPTEGVQRG